MADVNLEINIHSNIDEVTKKADNLFDTLKEAKALADELASLMDRLHLDIES